MGMKRGLEDHLLRRKAIFEAPALANLVDDAGRGEESRLGDKGSDDHALNEPSLLW
jgi:hypothetical protein